MNDIEWIVELQDFPGYFISTKGRVFSEYKKEKRIELKSNRNKNTGYLRVSLLKEGKRYTKSIHRLVGKTFLERIEGKNEIDHKSRIKTDNRLENLRWVDSRENKINRGINSRNTSGIKGVFYCKTYDKWIGCIQVEENKEKRKTFKTKEEAIKWRLEMEEKYYK